MQLKWYNKILVRSVSLLPKKWNKYQTHWISIGNPKCWDSILYPFVKTWSHHQHLSIGLMIFGHNAFFLQAAPLQSPPLLNCLFATPWTKGHFISLCDRNPSLPLPFPQDAGFHLRSLASQEIRRYLYFAQTIIKPWAEQSSFELCESRANNKEEDV